MKYHNVTVGGTWDRLHKGHKKLIDTAFAAAMHVWLGITSDVFVSRLTTKSANLKTSIEGFEERKQAVMAYLKGKNWLAQATIVPIDDRFGTTLEDKTLEAIVVSPETELVATEINLFRTQKNWPALEIIRIEWVLAQDQKPIHSIRIRSGEIDREGGLFRLPSDWRVRRLPDLLREHLRKPLGNLISDLSHLRDLGRRLVISIGDVVTESLLKNSLTPDISIVDLKVSRKTVYENVENLGFGEIKVLKKAKNQAGTLNYEAYAALLALITSSAKGAVLQVDGEEDLLTLFAIFLAPLDSLIVYGQPGEGVVVVPVTEEKKQEVRNYLSKFTI